MQPMLAKTASIARLSQCIDDDAWFLQQKLDGDRLMICVDDGKVRALNRAGEPRRNTVPRKVLDQFRGLPGTWRFDGELLDQLWIFDLPQALDLVRPDNPLEFRLDVLERLFRQWDPDRQWLRLLPTARSAEAKMHLADAIGRQGGEGMMLKDRSGRYRPGARSELMLKLKLWNTLDAVVTATGVDGKHNCEYSVFNGPQLTKIGSCSLEGKPPVHVGDVIELKYLYASEDQLLYQPSLLKVRDDKAPVECSIDQLIFTNRGVVDLEEAR